MIIQVKREHRQSMVKKMQANKRLIRFLKTPQRIWLKITKNSINDHRVNVKKKLKPFIIFVICFLLVLFALFNIPLSNVPPYVWAKSSLSTSVTPKNVERGESVLFSGHLGGDDVADKTIALQVTDDQGDVMTSFSATTNSKGLFDYTWDIPEDCSIGKHSITATFEMLSSTENFMVKLAAPQKYGGKYVNWLTHQFCFFQGFQNDLKLANYSIE